MNMQIKLFGRSLFEVSKNRTDELLRISSEKRAESKYLIDFYQMREGNSGSNSLFEMVAIATPVSSVDSKEAQAKKEEGETSHSQAPITPKGVFELKLLNNKSFSFNTDEAYVDQQISDFKDKLALIKNEEYDMSRGVNEIASIISRFENRKKYPEVNAFFENFPYTTSGAIADLVKKYEHLQLGLVAQFLADMPKEAVELMKEYNTWTDKVCGKQAVYYIIADKKDFNKSDKRRDPILLVQSPFGHFWQILGAWDDEVLLVDEL